MRQLENPSQQGIIADPPSWLAGRDREWRRLTARLTDALRGSGGAITLSGEAGIGKTALVEALTDTARRWGAMVVIGGCYELGLTPPYGPWTDAFANAHVDTDLPRVLTAPHDDSSDAYASGVALFEQVRTWLIDLAAQQPMVIVLEDLHWADVASLDLLRFLGRRLDRVPILLLMTWRDDEASSQHPLYRVLPALIRETRPLRIELRRLTVGDVGNLIIGRYHLPEDERDALAAWVQGHAGGNPFFVGEVLLALEQGGSLRQDGEGWRFTAPAAFSVPPLVRQVIEQRLAHLTTPTQHLLEYASIIGQEASFSLLQAASDATEDDLATAFDEAVEARIVIEVAADDVAVRFRHALVRETLYERQTMLRRRARHRRVAEVLLAEPVSSPLALGHHFQAAHDARAVEWLALAGERSLERYAPHDAIAHLTRAGDLAERFQTTLPQSVLRARGRAWEMIGDYDLARADYEASVRAAREGCDRRAEWQGLLDLGALWAERDYRRSGEAFEQALALARRELDDAAIAHSLNAVGNWYINREEPYPALEHHQDALAIFTRVGDRHGTAATLDVLAMAHYIVGDVRTAAREYERAVQLLDELNDRQLLVSALANWATTGGYFETEAVVAAEGSFEHWLGLNQRARAVAGEIGWAAGQAYADITGGAMLGSRGDMGQALALCWAGMGVAERIGHQQWTVVGNAVLGRLYADLLDTARAREHLELALSQARAIGSRYLAALSAANLGSLLVDINDLEAATATLRIALDSDRPAVTSSQRLCRLSWARLLLARGEVEPALHTLDQLISSAPNAVGLESLPWLALARGTALALLERFDDAEVDFGSARRGALALGYRHLLWRADLALGRLLHGRGRVADARTAFDQALAVADEIAATISSDQSRAAFRRAVRDQLAQAGGIAAPPASVSAGLSPREVEVLRLVATGLTDAEVGAKLFISPRTVGRHLESIYAKLGVGSRTAATAFAYKRRLID